MDIFSYQYIQIFIPLFLIDNSISYYFLNKYLKLFLFLQAILDLEDLIYILFLENTVLLNHLTFWDSI